MMGPSTGLFDNVLEFTHPVLRSAACHCEDLSLVGDVGMCNFFCERCGRCWHIDVIGGVRRVTPPTCPGCEHRDRCTVVWDAEHPPGPSEPLVW